MNVYRIDWAAMVDRALVTDLAAAAGLAAAPTVTAAKPALARILEMSGGWPYATTKPAQVAQRAFALRLLGEAFAQTLGRTPQQVLGLEVGLARRGMRAITTVPRVEVNIANRSELTTVPALTPRTAQAIVDDRLRGGYLRSMADLVERIDGVGPALSRKLAPYLGFMQPSAPRTGATGDLAQDLGTLLAQETVTEPTARFLRVLDRVAMHVAANPHPHTRNQLPRTVKVPMLPEGVEASRTLLLPGKQYYYHVQRAIRAAEARVDVAMFHIALPADDHPTKRLLEALAAATGRGVNVRVLVDRDRASDPYKSTVINSASVNFLLDAGASVRIDAPENLLHSKFLVIDADHTIIGSHNWSAGSYFGFDDFSVDVESTAFARATRRRFEDLWRGGERASRSYPLQA